jgi:hypothetical protein
MCALIAGPIPLGNEEVTNPGHGDSSSAAYHQKFPTMKLLGNPLTPGLIA